MRHRRNMILLLILLLLSSPCFAMTTGTLNSSGAMSLGEETAADATSITPSGNFTATYQSNSQSVGTLTMNAPTNAGKENQSLMIIITSTNVQTFSWNSAYEGGAVALPTVTTGSSKTDYFPFIYSTHLSKWVSTSPGVGGF